MPNVRRPFVPDDKIHGRHHRAARVKRTAVTRRVDNSGIVARPSSHNTIPISVMTVVSAYRIFHCSKCVSRAFFPPFRTQRSVCVLIRILRVRLLCADI